MLHREDIENLAQLARISISDAEKDDLQKTLGSVLEYVSEVSSVVTGDVLHEVGPLRNVLRADDHPREGGQYSEVILANAPAVEDGHVKVEKIL